MAEEKSQATAAVRVRYWGSAGRAHPIRLALVLGGIAFEDEFIEGAEHKATKAAGGRRWSGLPELVIYDAEGKEVTTIGQSYAMLRYVGTITGIYPSNALQRAFVDELLDSLNDAKKSLMFNGEKDKEKQKAMREAIIAKDGALTYWLNKFVLRLEENEKRGNTNGFIVGNSVTIADLALASSFETLVSGFWDHIPKDLFSKNFPKLQTFIDTVFSIPVIKEFNAKFDARKKDFHDKEKADGKAALKVVTYPGKLLSKGGHVSRAVCILNADGNSGVSGKVIFEDVGGKTKIKAEVNGLTPGKHGFHIHQLGDLSGGCKTAKGHFNPIGKTHGGPEDKERHVGDLGNIVADDKGSVVFEMVDELVQLNGVDSVIGRSIVVHAGVDDLGKGGFDDSLTTGHAGARVACGVIGRGD
eukprot:400223_1